METVNNTETNQAPGEASSIEDRPKELDTSDDLSLTSTTDPSIDVESLDNDTNESSKPDSIDEEKKPLSPSAPPLPSTTTTNNNELYPTLHEKEPQPNSEPQPSKTPVMSFKDEPTSSDDVDKDTIVDIEDNDEGSQVEQANLKAEPWSTPVMTLSDEPPSHSDKQKEHIANVEGDSAGSPVTQTKADVGAANFWLDGNYKRVVKRIEEGAKMVDDLAKLIHERAEIELMYANKLKGIINLKVSLQHEKVYPTSLT